MRFSRLFYAERNPQTPRACNKTEKKKKSDRNNERMRKTTVPSSSASCPPGAYARAYFARGRRTAVAAADTVVRDDVKVDKETSSSHDST